MNNEKNAAPADWINDVVRDVAELPDRDSPPESPDMMLVTAIELHDIIARHAPTTVPDHSEREAANAGGLPVDLIHDFRDAINIAHHRADHAGDTTRMKRWKEVSRRLEAYVRTINAPATIAAGQEAANAKDAALRKINDIRNSIIGLQALNWSEHVYPLVAALDEAGYEGMEYPEARAYYGTLLERAVKAEDALAAMAAVGAAGKEGGDK